MSISYALCSNISPMFAVDLPLAAESSGVYWMIGAVVGAVVIGGAAYYAHHLVQENKKNSHPELFRGLCQAHELDRGSRKLLKQVVRVYQMNKPALIFVEPKWLRSAAGNAAFQAESENLRQLQDRLFGRSTNKKK